VALSLPDFFWHTQLDRLEFWIPMVTWLKHNFIYNKNNGFSYLDGNEGDDYTEQPGVLILIQQ